MKRERVYTFLHCLFRAVIYQARCEIKAKHVLSGPSHERDGGNRPESVHSSKRCLEKGRECRESGEVIYREYRNQIIMKEGTSIRKGETRTKTR